MIVEDQSPCTNHAPQTLLHNMSCRPNKTLSHTGEDRCVRISFSLWKVTGKPRVCYPGSVPMRIPIEQTPCVSDWREALGSRSRSETAVLERCRKLVSSASALGFLPPIAPVLDNAKGQEIEGLTDNIAITLGVLGRCSDKVFIRRKTPVIDANALSRRITLILPENWRFEP